MKPDARFLRRRVAHLPPAERKENERFWAHVRTLSEEIGYTGNDGGIASPESVQTLCSALAALGLATHHVVQTNGSPTTFGSQLLEYLQFRAHVLNTRVRDLLMTEGEARAEFIGCLRRYRPDPLSIPWNKQKHEKKAPAFLTSIVNMVLASRLGAESCDFDPLSLTTITHGGEPFRTLARRVDGAYPSVVNPIAVWEIKEYYYTTTFGSRVADAVYETLLDGLELETLEESKHGKIFHYLIVDARDTWWGQGNPYLCRIIDMLHMGYLDEAVFGRETEQALIAAAETWLARQSTTSTSAIQGASQSRAKPPPKHKRLSPADRKKRAAKWNEWAARSGIVDYPADPSEPEDDKRRRLEWQRQRQGLKTDRESEE